MHFNKTQIRSRARDQLLAREPQSIPMTSMVNAPTNRESLCAA